MLKTSESTQSKTQPDEGGVRVGGSSKARRDGHKFNKSKIDGSEVGDDDVRKIVQNLSKSKKKVESDFFILGAKLAFIKLRQGFIKALILYHFDLKHYIHIKTNVSDYAINGVLS